MVGSLWVRFALLRKPLDVTHEKLAVDANFLYIQYREG